jgi:hypothetical protein
MLHAHIDEEIELLARVVVQGHRKECGGKFSVLVIFVESYAKIRIVP